MPQPAPMPTGADARTAERKRVTGRARIVLQGGGASLSGKMVDISVNGACVLLDDMVPVKKYVPLSAIFFKTASAVCSVRQPFRFTAYWPVATASRWVFSLGRAVRPRLRPLPTSCGDAKRRCPF